MLLLLFVIYFVFYQFVLVTHGMGEILVTYLPVTSDQSHVWLLAAELDQILLFLEPLTILSVSRGGDPVNFH